MSPESHRSPDSLHEGEVCATWCLAKITMLKGSRFAEKYQPGPGATCDRLQWGNGRIFRPLHETFYRFVCERSIRAQSISR